MSAQQETAGDQAVAATDGIQKSWNAQELEARWGGWWEQHDVFKAVDDDSKPRRYVLDMFPYPSGDLHMGHAEAFAMGDVVARYWKLQGFDVLHPIGWDSFGLPAENAAIKRNEHPAGWTYKNIETQKASFKRYGIAVDWDRELHTSDPEYYRWTQWLFLKFYERGLAYRKDSPVNWCPKDQTVLANEQVVNGTCERCHTAVTKKSLNQWYFRITDYADRLLDDMKMLEGKWPERVLSMQRNWIGRSRGAHVTFAIDGPQGEGQQTSIKVFTTRPDTLYGATFLVVAGDSELASELVSEDRSDELSQYRESIKSLSDIERQSTDREKTGIFLGRYAVNPINRERIPIWAADYVLAEYGTGAIMAVPAHDQRDLDFAKTYNLPVRVVIDDGQEDPAVSGTAITGDGHLINSEKLNGLNKSDAISAALDIIQSSGLGEPTINYRLRDWLLSRQRFWGAPIPIIHCDSCGEVPVPENQLPVRLPDNLRGEQLAPKGQSPLAAASDWVNVSCPSCQGQARRDTDTMDTFVDSSWYFLRYLSPHNDSEAFDAGAARRWGQVDQYVGGVEHAILHLLYARFFTKVLFDMGLIEHSEPFERLLNQGQVLNGGKAMSKSLGNGVDLGQQMDEFGVDAVRLTMVFASPPEDDVDWADVSPAGAQKFLARAWRLAQDVRSTPGSEVSSGSVEVRRTTHRALADVQSSLENHKFNVVIAKAMELVNALRKAIDSGVGPTDAAVREGVEVVAIVLSLVAPYTAEDMWRALGHNEAIACSRWPAIDESLLVDETITAIVQIQGKVKDRLEVPLDITETELQERALASAIIKELVADQPIRKVIVRAPKLVNIVI